MEWNTHTHHNNRGPRTLMSMSVWHPDSSRVIRDGMNDACQETDLYFANRGPFRRSIAIQMCPRGLETWFRSSAGVDRNMEWLRGVAGAHGNRGDLRVWQGAAATSATKCRFKAVQISMNPPLFLACGTSWVSPNDANFLQLS